MTVVGGLDPIPVEPCPVCGSPLSRRYRDTKWVQYGPPKCTNLDCINRIPEESGMHFPFLVVGGMTLIWCVVGTAVWYLW